MSHVVSYLNNLMGRPLWAPLGYYGSILEPISLIVEPRRSAENEGSTAPLTHPAI